MKKERSVIPENVMRILERASDYAGRYEAESFSQSIWSDLSEGNMQSPIEFAFYIGLKTVAKFNYLDECEPIDCKTMSPGLGIRTQVPIGPYRADFLIEYWRYKEGRSTAEVFRQVVVECDGTAFHERTELERRNEKRRDRYMQKIGMKVFRYTGKELLDDPYKIAAEVIGYVTDDEDGTLTPEQYFS